MGFLVINSNAESHEDPRNFSPTKGRRESHQLFEDSLIGTAKKVDGCFKFGSSNVETLECGIHLRIVSRDLVLSGAGATILMGELVERAAKRRIDLICLMDSLGRTRRGDIPLDLLPVGALQVC